MRVRIEQLQSVLSRVKFHGMKFSISHMDHELCEGSLKHFYFMIVHDVVDSGTLKPTDIVTKCTVDDYAFRDEADFLKWVWHQVKLLVLHEAEEFFLVDGVRVRDPHAKDRSFRLTA